MHLVAVKVRKLLIWRLHSAFRLKCNILPTISGGKGLAIGFACDAVVTSAETLLRTYALTAAAKSLAKLEQWSAEKLKLKRLQAHLRK